MSAIPSQNSCGKTESSWLELQQYREMYEHAPIGIIRTTVEGEILKINPAMISMLGHDPQEAPSCGRIIEALYADSGQRRILLAEALQRGRLYNFESRFRKKNGEIITCLLHTRVARDEQGTVRFLESFVEDITQRKRISEDLAESERLYRGLFENTGAGTIIIEQDMSISYANTGFLKMTGYSKEEIEGRMKWTVIIADPADLERMVRYHTDRRQGSYAPIEYEFVLQDKAGERKNIFLRVDMVPGTQRSVASLLDITALKRAKRSIADRDATLKGILEVVNGYIYTATEDCRVSFMNESLIRYVGEKATGKTCHRVIFGLDQPCGWCFQQLVFSGESVQAEFINPVNSRWYHLTCIPLYSENGHVYARQGILMDIHDQKQEEEAAIRREEHLVKENIRLKESIRDRFKFGDIIGKSAGMQKVYELVVRAAAVQANVIIHGESGTGKELVARAIHNTGQWSAHAFVPVNCGAIPEHLFESEFFGYRKGGFTGANRDKPGYFDLAHRGTLFLDELGEISLEMQVKLLRVLDGHPYHPVGGTVLRQSDVRIITATNKNLHDLIERGDMREDFFFRIHIIPIYIPPLRKRKEDIPLLVEHFMEKYKLAQKPTPPIRGNTMDAMLGYAWPGNVRELENTIQRYVSLNTLDFFYEKSIDTRSSNLVEPLDAGYSLKEVMGRHEKEYIFSLLHRYRWNRTRVAKVLGIERKTLYLKMKHLGITEN